MQLARPIIRRLYRETFRFGGCARARARAPYPFTGRFDRRAISRSVRGAKVPMLSKFAPFPCWSIRPVPCPPSPPSRRTGDSESRRNFARASSLLALVGGMGYFSSFFFLLSPSPPPPPLFDPRGSSPCGKGDRGGDRGQIIIARSTRHPGAAGLQPGYIGIPARRRLHLFLLKRERAALSPATHREFPDVIAPARDEIDTSPKRRNGDDGKSREHVRVLSESPELGYSTGTP
jgi:hypothetical protein